VLTVVTLVTGEEDLLWRVGTHEPATAGLTAVWWVVLALVLIGAVQGAACRQVLRGTPADGGGQVAWLRGALYATVVLALLPPGSWPADLPAALVQVVIVRLFFRVLDDAIPTWAPLRP
jgi:phosphatidylglycerophosphate synthase